MVRLGRKVGSLKRRVRSHVATEEMKNCTVLWPEAHFQVKLYKTHHSRATFGSSDVEKLHAAVARSAFSSQNVENTPFPGHCSKFRCGTIARSTFATQNRKLTGPGHFLQLGCRTTRRCGNQNVKQLTGLDRF